MPDKNSIKEDQKTSQAGSSIPFKVMLAVIGLGVLAIILRAAGIF